MNEGMIYESKEHAKLACERYVEAMHRLMEEFGVWESSEDSCSRTFIHAQYRTTEGKIEEYCHW